MDTYAAELLSISAIGVRAVVSNGLFVESGREVFKRLHAASALSFYGEHGKASSLSTVAIFGMRLSGREVFDRKQLYLTTMKGVGKVG